MTGEHTAAAAAAGTMRAVRLSGRRELTDTELPMPALGPGELRVRVLASGICGSDLAAYRGAHPYKTAPAVLGHEFCGVVEEVAGPATGFAPGDLVCSAAFSHCEDCGPCRAGAPHLCENKANLSHLGWSGSFAEYIVLRRNMTHRLPAGVDPEAGAMVEPLTIGLHAMRRAGAGRGRSVAVLGTGTIGLACTLAAARLGFAPPVCVDLGPAKGRLAHLAGAGGYVDARAGDVAAGVRAELPAGADVVVIAAGYPGVMEHAARVLRPGGTAVVVTYFERPVTTDLNPLVGAEATIRFSALSTAEDFREVIGWLAEGSVDPRPLITHRFPLERAADALALMDRADGTVGKVMLQVTAAPPHTPSPAVEYARETP